MEISTLLQRLVTGSALRVGELILAAIVAFFMMPFLVQHLGVRDYGLWVLVGTILSYHCIMDFGLSMAVSRFYSQSLGRRNYEEINNIVSSALVTFFIIGFVAFIAILATSFTIPYFLTDPNEGTVMTKLVIIAGVAVATQFPLRTFGGILTSVARHDLIVTASLFRLITRTTLVVYFILNDHRLITLALITMITEILGNLLEYRFAKSQAPFLVIGRKHVNSTTIKQLFSFGWIAFIDNVATLLRNHLLPLIVAALNGIEMVTIYAVAIRLLAYFEQLVKTSMGITMPIFSQLEGQGKRDQMKEGYQITLTTTTILTTLIGCNLLFFGKPFIIMWMGEDFALSYNVLVFLTIANVLFLTQIPSTEMLYSMSKHMYNATISIIGIIASVVVGGVFVKIYPEVGIAIGFAFGIGISMSLLPIFVSKMLGFDSIVKVYLKAIIGTSIKIGVPLTVYFYLIHEHVNSTFWSLLTWGLVEMVFMIPICYFVLPERVKIVVQNQIRRIVRYNHSKGALNVA